MSGLPYLSWNNSNPAYVLNEKIPKVMKENATGGRMRSRVRLTQIGKRGEKSKALAKLLSQKNENTQNTHNTLNTLNTQHCNMAYQFKCRFDPKLDASKRELVIAEPMPSKEQLESTGVLIEASLYSCVAPLVLVEISPSPTHSQEKEKERKDVEGESDAIVVVETDTGGPKMRPSLSAARRGDALFSLCNQRWEHIKREISPDTDILDTNTNADSAQMSLCPYLLEQENDKSEKSMSMSASKSTSSSFSNEVCSSEECESWFLRTPDRLRYTFRRYVQDRNGVCAFPITLVYPCEYDKRYSRKRYAYVQEVHYIACALEMDTPQYNKADADLKRDRLLKEKNDAKAAKELDLEELEAATKGKSKKGRPISKEIEKEMKIKEREQKRIDNMTNDPNDALSECGNFGAISLSSTSLREQQLVEQSAHSFEHSHVQKRLKVIRNLSRRMARRHSRSRVLVGRGGSRDVESNTFDLLAHVQFFLLNAQHSHDQFLVIVQQQIWSEEQAQLWKEMEEKRSRKEVERRLKREKEEEKKQRVAEKMSGKGKRGSKIEKIEKRKSKGSTSGSVSGSSVNSDNADTDNQSLGSQSSKSTSASASASVSVSAPSSVGINNASNVIDRDDISVLSENTDRTDLNDDFDLNSLAYFRSGKTKTTNNSNSRGSTNKPVNDDERSQITTISTKLLAITPVLPSDGKYRGEGRWDPVKGPQDPETYEQWLFGPTVHPAFIGHTTWAGGSTWSALERLIESARCRLLEGGCTYRRADFDPWEEVRANYWTGGKWGKQGVARNETPMQLVQSAMNSAMNSARSSSSRSGGSRGGKRKKERYTTTIPTLIREMSSIQEQENEGYEYTGDTDEEVEVEGSEGGGNSDDVVVNQCSASLRDLVPEKILQWKKRCSQVHKRLSSHKSNKSDSTANASVSVVSKNDENENENDATIEEDKDKKSTEAKTYALSIYTDFLKSHQYHETRFSKILQGEWDYNAGIGRGGRGGGGGGEEAIPCSVVPYPAMSACRYTRLLNNDRLVRLVMSLRTEIEAELVDVMYTASRMLRLQTSTSTSHHASHTSSATFARASRASDEGINTSGKGQEKMKEGDVVPLKKVKIDVNLKAELEFLEHPETNRDSIEHVENNNKNKPLPLPPIEHIEQRKGLGKRRIVPIRAIASDSLYDTSSFLFLKSLNSLNSGVSVSGVSVGGTMNVLNESTSPVKTLHSTPGHGHGHTLDFKAALFGQQTKTQTQTQAQESKYTVASASVSASKVKEMKNNLIAVTDVPSFELFNEEGNDTSKSLDHLSSLVSPVYLADDSSIRFSPYPQVSSASTLTVTQKEMTKETKETKSSFVACTSRHTDESSGDADLWSFSEFSEETKDLNLSCVLPKHQHCPRLSSESESEPEQTSISEDESKESKATAITTITATGYKIESYEMEMEKEKDKQTQKTDKNGTVIETEASEEETEEGQVTTEAAHKTEKSDVSVTLALPSTLTTLTTLLNKEGTEGEREDITGTDTGTDTGTKDTRNTKTKELSLAEVLSLVFSSTALVPYTIDSQLSNGNMSGTNAVAQAQKRNMSRGVDISTQLVLHFPADSSKGELPSVSICTYANNSNNSNSGGGGGGGGVDISHTSSLLEAISVERAVSIPVALALTLKDAVHFPHRCCCNCHPVAILCDSDSDSALKSVNSVVEGEGDSDSQMKITQKRNSIIGEAQLFMMELGTKKKSVKKKKRVWSK